MITVRRDAVRTQGRAPKRGRNQRDCKAGVRHRGLKLVFDHAEVVKCDISATANTLKDGRTDRPNDRRRNADTLPAVEAHCLRPAWKDKGHLILGNQFSALPSSTMKVSNARRQGLRGSSPSRPSEHGHGPRPPYRPSRACLLRDRCLRG